MSVAIVNYMVKRIPCRNYEMETHYVKYSNTTDMIEKALKRDKNVIGFYKI